MPIIHGKIVPLFTQFYFHLYTEIKVKTTNFALQKIIYELITH